MATKIIKALVDGVIQNIEVEDMASPEQMLSPEERLDILEDKHEVIITDGNLLVGNGTTDLEEMTPDEVLSHINGASVRTMTTAEYEEMDDSEFNANTLYMLTDDDSKPDWNQNDESAVDYIKNRTHYESIETVNEPLNITWDGNTEGLVSVDADGDIYWKLSEVVLSDAQIKSATVVMSGYENDEDGIYAVADYWDEIVSDGCVTEGVVWTDDFIVVREPNSVMWGVTFPEVGIYSPLFMSTTGEAYVSSLTTTEPVEHTKTVVHKLDKKFLPDGYTTETYVTSSVSTHNTSTSAHNDIRVLVNDLKTQVNNFLDVDDTTTDQLSEVITLINNNKGTLESLTTSKVNVSDIIDNLTTASANKVLSANQGVVIKNLLNELEAALDEKADSSAFSSYYTKTEIDNMELITVEDIDAICRITDVYTTETNDTGTTVNVGTFDTESNEYGTTVVVH